MPPGSEQAGTVACCDCANARRSHLPTPGVVNDGLRCQVAPRGVSGRPGRFILKDEAGRLRGAIPPRQKRRNLEVVQSEKSVIEFPASKTTSKDDPPVPDHETSSN
jgi:hypothetical protein